MRTRVFRFMLTVIGFISAESGGVSPGSEVRKELKCFYVPVTSSPFDELPSSTASHEIFDSTRHQELSRNDHGPVSTELGDIFGGTSQHVPQSTTWSSVTGDAFTASHLDIHGATRSTLFRDKLGGSAVTSRPQQTLPTGKTALLALLGTNLTAHSTKENSGLLETAPKNTAANKASLSDVPGPKEVEVSTVIVINGADSKDTEVDLSDVAEQSPPKDEARDQRIAGTNFGDKQQGLLSAQVAQNTADETSASPAKTGVSESAVDRDLREFGAQKPSKSVSNSSQKKEAPALLSQGSSSDSSKDSGHTVPGAVLYNAETDAKENFGTKFNITWSERGNKNDQGNVWDELIKLGSKTQLSPGEIQGILAKSEPGVDYPIYTGIPTTKFTCNQVNQPGFYADPETRCQVIRRCDINGVRWNYLCPNATVFNQITLICDWYFNVDCSKAVDYYDYSNPRLYHSDWLLLDDPPK